MMKDLPRYIDITFCLVVFPVMALIFPIERWFHNFPAFVVVAVVWIYLLYAVNRSLTVPGLFGNKRRKLLAYVLILASVAVTAALANIVLYTPKPNVHDVGIVRMFPKVQQYQQAIWSWFMITEAFSFAVGLLIQADAQRRRRHEVEAERDKAEIALYKAQIKPHFMFNTLNSLYGLFLTKDASALESLEKFISMTRYVHLSSHRDFMTLDEEIGYMRQYVGLQSLRLSDKTSVTLDVDICDGTLKLPPMLLLTFVENCFKHGVSSVEKSRIVLTLTEKDGKIIFTTSNRILPAPRIGGHMGIENCRRRLALLYPARHSLKIEDDGDNFNVRLEINLR